MGFILVFWIAALSADGQNVVLIRGGTVLTVTRGTLPNTDILIRDGKIAQIGPNLTAPPGAQVIDARGKFVMPGIIDAHSHMAIDNVNEATNPVTAEVRIRDVVNPYEVNIYRALAGGVTTIHSMHGSANVIGGQPVTMKLRYGEPVERMILQDAPRTIKFALGENPTRVHGRASQGQFGGGRENVTPATRMGVEQVMRKAFEMARRYMAEWEVYERARQAWERSRRRGPEPIAPRKDERLETLAAILRGEVIVHCHSYRADEILMVLRVFRDFGIKRLVFQHVLEGYKVAKELAEFGAMASTFSDWWAYKFEVYYATPYNAAIMHQYGVNVSLNSDSDELVRRLYHEAAKAVRYGGVPEDAALAMITLNPAKQIGLDHRIGSIEVGKDADLAIFSAHPLSVYAVCEMTLVDGVVRFDRSKDPDDMRLAIDPDESLEDAYVQFNPADYDRCMLGAEAHEGAWMGGVDLYELVEEMMAHKEDRP
ncbi:MAG: amidohydrolase [Bacteroidetes bacterium]|nr:amidohydrolase [Rhodothermia bacterium]MCS7155180.1 amidohydrolase [Bacteroidota bacterium]MCX7906193.1 amidohydrolase [Bacteroidota bacterium]MDW8138320.1 amidohydrolase [Bacteroidota bacterium]MDW8286005.1 amidohydrolase [Bacteroidota bacterium]